MERPLRREILEAIAAIPAAGAACTTENTGDRAVAAPPPSSREAPPSRVLDDAPSRLLGHTGASVPVFSLGGEGVLRTRGRAKEAVPVILEALRVGVRYCDTAPAYAESQDYYGAAFREAGKAARDGVFLATKTHARDYDGALRLLDDSLRRLGTDRVDLWQMHDLRDVDDLDQMFGPNGAVAAAHRAKDEGRIRFIGITGHHDPAILVEAMRRHAFDTVLCAINPSDPRRTPFIPSVVAEARKRGMGVIGMKALAAGALVSERTTQPAELLRYAASIADTVIIGCASPAEVRANAEAARAFALMSEPERIALEERIRPRAERYDTFKA
jgi:aryl-alcohol dehydrogenase-like predicted oxidoreductase